MRNFHSIVETHGKGQAVGLDKLPNVGFPVLDKNTHELDALVLKLQIAGKFFPWQEPPAGIPLTRRP
jgi:hypothetical protein